MDVNSARIIITQMQGCFKELNIPVVNESEMHNYDGFSNAINFRSWLEKNGNLAETISSVYLSHNMIRLTMNYYENKEDFDESTIGDLFNLLNSFNSSNPRFYWSFYSDIDKLEFRTAYHLSGYRFSERQFKSILKRFLKQGPLYYSYFRRLIEHKEDSKMLFKEMQVRLEAL